MISRSLTRLVPLRMRALLHGPLMFMVMLGMSGCSIIGPRAVTPDAPRISQVVREIPAQSAMATDAPAVDRDEVLSLYQSALAQVNDVSQRFEIARRIAELELQRAGDAAANGEVADFGVAIDALENLLANVPDGRDQTIFGKTSDSAALRYKLAYAYDLRGEQSEVRHNLNRIIAESQNAEEVIEAHFRRGELLFSAGDYAAAAADYAWVAATDNTYQLHARYMLGWSRFKQGDLDRALPPTFAALGELLEQSPGEQADLLADATRMAVITLDYLDGPATLGAQMALLGKPDWQSHLYRALGDWYREKERFSDSALTWESFIEANPMHEEAPQIFLEVIETYRSAGFVDDIPPRKLAFVDQFDRGSAFYALHGEAVFENYRDTLMTFVDHFTTAAHAHAQSSEVPGDWALAAGWYERWLANFAGAPATGEMMFLMAETLGMAQDWPRAIAAWQQLLENYPDHPRARESMYAIVDATENWSRDLGAPLLEDRVDANLAFAARYPDDARAPASQVKAAQLLFDAGQFIRAAEVADTALASWSLADLQVPSLLISGHSWFELADFGVAETRYRRVMDLAPSETIQARLLATVFRQAEQAEAVGDLALAIALYGELQNISPGDPAAIAAHYDIASLYEAQGNVTAAIDQLVSFRTAYPRHALVRDIPLRLVDLFESTEQYGAAALELSRVYQDKHRDDETRRLALYRMGELYLAAADNDMAIATFRDYAHGYPAPVALRVEAMHHMDRLYEKAGESEKRSYWLRKKTEVYASLSEGKITPRIRSLAADAALVLAQDKLARFEDVALALPLKRSLKAKRKVMTSAIDAFEKATTYEVAEVTTASTYFIGTIYQSLARSLMASDRPGGLSELELEQYELLLEEQAFPFEEQAIELHEINLQRGWNSAWDGWIDRSLAELQALSPGRYRRDEPSIAAIDVLF